MAYISNWVRYMAHKLEYSLTLGLKNHTQRRVIDREFISVVMKNLLYGRITYLNSVKGEGMAPTMGSHDNTLLVLVGEREGNQAFRIGDFVVDDRTIRQVLSSLSGELSLIFTDFSFDILSAYCAELNIYRHCPKF